MEQPRSERVAGPGTLIPVALALFALVSPGAVAHQGETGPGHHADDTPSSVEGQGPSTSGGGDRSASPSPGGGNDGREEAPGAPSAAEPDPDPTIPAVVLAIVVAGGTWILLRRRRAGKRGEAP